MTTQVSLEEYWLEQLVWVRERVRAELTAQDSGLEETYADLGGVHEIAALLGVSKDLVNRWIERRESTNCPKPVRLLNGARIFSLRQWQAWYALWKITRGRARKSVLEEQREEGADDSSGGEL